MARAAETPEADGASFANRAIAARPAANVPAVALSISNSGNEESSSSSRNSLAGSMSLLVPFMLEKIMRGMHLRMAKLKIARRRYSTASLSAVRQARCCPPSTGIVTPVTLVACAR